MCSANSSLKSLLCSPLVDEDFSRKYITKGIYLSHQNYMGYLAIISQVLKLLTESSSTFSKGKPLKIEECP